MASEEIVALRQQIDQLSFQITALQRARDQGMAQSQPPAQALGIESAGPGPLQLNLYAQKNLPDEAGNPVYVPVQANANGELLLDDSTACCFLGYAAGGDLTGTYPNPTIANNAVTDAKLRQSAASSVIGRSVASSGNVADIVSPASNTVLRDNGSGVIGFGSVALNQANAVSGVLAASHTENAGPGATGPIGDGTHVPAVTIDVHGRVTGLSSVAITPSGNTIYQNAGAPGSLSGNANDLYFDSTNYEFYLNNGSGSWVLCNLNASDLGAGSTPNGRYPGGSFNGNSMLVQLDGSSKLPGVDGSNLTNLPAPPTLSSGTGNLDASGNLAISVSSSAVAVVASGDGGFLAGVLKVSNGGGGSWTISSSAGIADSGVTVAWIAY